MIKGLFISIKDLEPLVTVTLFAVREIGDLARRLRGVMVPSLKRQPIRQTNHKIVSSELKPRPYTPCSFLCCTTVNAVKVSTGGGFFLKL